MFFHEDFLCWVLDAKMPKTQALPTRGAQFSGGERSLKR